MASLRPLWLLLSDQESGFPALALPKANNCKSSFLTHEPVEQELVKRIEWTDEENLIVWVFKKRIIDIVLNVLSFVGCLGKLFFSVVKYTSHKITMLTTLSAQFHGIKYIHNMIQPSLPSIFRAFSSSQTGSLYWLNNNSSYPPPQSLMPTTLLSVFLNLASPGASYKWHHTIFVPLSQAYFTGHDVLKVYSCSSMCQNLLPL